MHQRWHYQCAVSFRAAKMMNCPEPISLPTYLPVDIANSIYRDVQRNKSVVCVWLHAAVSLSISMRKSRRSWSDVQTWLTSIHTCFLSYVERNTRSGSSSSIETTGFLTRERTAWGLWGEWRTGNQPERSLILEPSDTCDNTSSFGDDCSASGPRS